ncbi:PepSY-associated TM helix domain-containing protein [Isosphaeraceae bacterium EP7]
MRWLHIYLSMLGLAVTLFFAVTGLTLNHPQWFHTERRIEAEGTIEGRWLTPRPGADGATDDVARLEIVEHLRASQGFRGALADFRVDDRECSVTFKGPGYSADAFIDRETGRYTGSQTIHGLVAVLNDLHKGRDTGPAWSWLIDVSAVVLVVISLTGLILLFYLKLRRRPGLVVALVGLILSVAVAYLWVP